MGIFDDKKYEELDWISQAVEPVESDLIGLVAGVPDEIDVDFETFRGFIEDSYSMEHVRVSNVVRRITKRYIERSLNWNETGLLNSMFKFQVEPGTTVDFETKTINGSIKIIKKRVQLEEKDLIDLMGKELTSVTDGINLGQGSIARLNEVLDMLGNISKDVLSSRSPRKRLHALKFRIRGIAKNDEWKVRSPELNKKIGTWIKAYIENGNLAAWSNFCRFKLMTHSQRAIYSVQEVE